MSVAAGSIAAVDIAADIPGDISVGDIAVGDIAVGDIAVGNAVDVIGPAAARRAALAAQGFADARPPGLPTRRHLARLLSRIRLLQLDSVNVAVRAHYMPVFSPVSYTHLTLPTN